MQIFLRVVTQLSVCGHLRSNLFGHTHAQCALGAAMLKHYEGPSACCRDDNKWYPFPLLPLYWYSPVSSLKHWTPLTTHICWCLPYLLHIQVPEGITLTLTPYIGHHCRRGISHCAGVLPHPDSLVKWRYPLSHTAPGQPHNNVPRVSPWHQRHYTKLLHWRRYAMSSSPATCKP